MNKTNPENDLGWTVEVTPAIHPKRELYLRQAARGVDDDTPFLVIIRVGQAGYVPPSVEPRAHLGPTLFTAKVTMPIVRLLEEDPAVMSISASRRLING